MIQQTAIAGVGAAALGMVLTPGPNMMYLVSRTVAQGRRAGLVSLGGVAVGFALYLVAATAGITALFAVVPGIYLFLKLAGAAYLLWLAWQILRPGARSPFEPDPVPPVSTGRLFTMGLVTNLLNPKIALMYMALIPQFVSPEHGALWLQSLALGGVQIGVALTGNAVIIFAAGSIASFLGTRPLMLRAQRWFTGSVLAGIAVSLAADRTQPTAP